MEGDVWEKERDRRKVKRDRIGESRRGDSMKGGKRKERGPLDDFLAGA